MKDFHLTSIGEIKTKKTDINKIEIYITAIDAIGRSFTNESNIDIKVTEESIIDDYFDPARFKRQIEKTKIFFLNQQQREKDNDKILYDKYYIKELEDAVELIKKKPFYIKRVNDKFYMLLINYLLKKSPKDCF